MNLYFKKMALLAFSAILVVSSCTETTTTTTKEETEITTMDSTTKVLKENTDKLDEQTKKGRRIT